MLTVAFLMAPRTKTKNCKVLGVAADKIGELLKSAAINTNYQTIKTQVKELEFFGLIKVTKHERNEKNGRGFTSVGLVGK